MPVFTTIARPVRQHPALTYLRLADQVCQTLGDHEVDCAPLAWLASTLGVPATELRTTVNYALHLGICEDAAAGPVMFCLPRQPIAAGFQALHRRGRMRLRLPARGLRPALTIRGHRVGPVPEHERAATLGGGELGYTINRLTRMAATWLPDSPDPTRYLFELIVDGWRHAWGVRQFGGLGIHRASFELPMAFGPGAPDGISNRLELVTNRRRGGYELVNVYPVPGRGCCR